MLVNSLFNGFIPDIYNPILMCKYHVTLPASSILGSDNKFSVSRISNAASHKFAPTVPRSNRKTNSDVGYEGWFVSYGIGSSVVSGRQMNAIYGKIVSKDDDAYIIQRTSQRGVMPASIYIEEDSPTNERQVGIRLSYVNNPPITSIYIVTLNGELTECKIYFNINKRWYIPLRLENLENDNIDIMSESFYKDDLIRMKMLMAFDKQDQYAVEDILLGNQI